MFDLKINFPDTFVSLLIVALSFCAVFFLGLLQIGQAIWGRKNEEKIEDDLVSLADQNIWYTVHEYPIKSRAL